MKVSATYSDIVQYRLAPYYPDTPVSCNTCGWKGTMRETRLFGRDEDFEECCPNCLEETLRLERANENL